MELTQKTIKRVLREHAGILNDFKVKKIGLFGSYSRNEQKDRSDIDLIVEFDLSGFDKNFTGYFDNYMDLLETLKRILGHDVDLVTNDMISPYIRPYILKDVRYLETA